MGKNLTIDLSRPLDISIPMKNGTDNPNCFWAPPPSFEPVRMDGFIGSVDEGGPVHFMNVTFNPHGNGTHTECVGHIAGSRYSIQDALKEYFFHAYLISCWPVRQPNGDMVVTSELFDHLPEGDFDALIIRTLPNTADKRRRQYAGTNPPFLEGELARRIADRGIKHLLVDLPSVDREVDGGVLSAHHHFWKYPHAPRTNCTITELIYVDEKILDGFYILNLQIVNFELDASPSKPVLYKPIG